MSHIPTKNPWYLCVAPMMDWTDRHCRYFHRILSPHARLYTEMIHAMAILHGNRQHLLAFSAKEHPVALQLGGADPKILAHAACIGEEYGYDEINLNVGCPSDRVQAGRFGACLMLEPQLVADCIAQMQSAVTIPVTVKCRIGVDQQDEMQSLYQLVTQVQQTGCQTFIVHARKAWLKGLSPAENRELPPLNYPLVYQLKRDFPELNIVLNGGLEDIQNIQDALQCVDGVMLGRVAYHQPMLLRQLEHCLFHTPHVSGHEYNDIIDKIYRYACSIHQQGGKVSSITRHILGLFQGVPGARQWRRTLSTQAHEKDADASIIKRAFECVQQATAAL